MVKLTFGRLLRRAREQKGFSLRQLAGHVNIDYSRLAKIEHGTRPAPGLTEVRRIADALDLDMADLVVASGTSREVMENLLWAERLQTEARSGSSDLPEHSDLLAKNTFPVRILEREGALCTVMLGEARLRAFSFAEGHDLILEIPPEAVVIHRRPAEAASSTAENVLPMQIRKVRRLGQVTNLVLGGAGFELNSLHASRSVDRMSLAQGETIYAAVQATAISAAAPI
jgi:transcriptional regulator with XRE-family HTH domain/molybdopterin-binding protein